MQIEIKTDSSYHEPKVIILTAAMTKEVQDIISRLSETSPALQIISGIRNGKLEVLEQESLIRIYASQGKVLAVTTKGEYTLRLRLYEAEERLDRNHFVRISHSEIINLRQVKSFDLSFAGTICVTLSNGMTTYASRRYVSKIKQLLGI